MYLGISDDPVETISDLRARGGTALVRYAPEEVRERIDLWGPVPALPLMRRVKDQFDPEHRLSPFRGRDLTWTSWAT
jgi:glycolate oxidase FAD binding subunit